MSSFENRKEEWTRRKSYLLRSLFEDDPMLSTISEEDESVAQYSPNTPRDNYAARHLETLDRPPSPLPNLIIEVVPRRPRIYDDEPEEYYKRLEKEMKKLYRRDYLNYSSCSSDNSELQSNYELHTFENNYCVPDLDRSLDVEKSKNDEDDRIVQDDLSRTIEKSSLGKSTLSTSFSSANKLEMTGKGKEMQSSDKSKESTQNNKVLTTVSSSDNGTAVEESSNENESEDERHDESMNLAENSGESSNNESILTIPEPDAMRRRETRLSLISITNHDFEKSPEKLVLYPGKQLEFMDESLDRNSNVTTYNITDITGKATSTPNSRRESNGSRLSNRKSFGDRFEPYSSISSGENFLPKCNRALQTSFSEEESENQSLWRNFFIGTPIFFRLQS